MKKNDFVEMYLTMIRNAYNKGNIEDLKAIKRTIELIPMKYLMDGKLMYIIQATKLTDLIDTNIEILAK